MGLGELLSLASAAAWAFAVILFKRSGETMPPFALNLIKNLIAAALMVPTLALWHGWAWPEFSQQDLWIMVVSGLIGIALADTLYLRALNTMGASRTGIVSSLYSPTVIILSFMFLGERLGGWQWMGFALVLFGVLLVSWNRGARDVDARMVRKGVLYAAGGVVLMAIGVVMVKHILEREAFLWVVQVRLLGGIAGMLVILVLRRRVGVLIDQLRQPHHWGQIVLGSFLGTYLALIFWLGGYKYTLASIASVLNETSSIFIVLLSWWLLSEALTARKLWGVAATFGGVILLTLAI